MPAIPLGNRRFTADEIWQAVVAPLPDGTWAIQTIVDGIVLQMPAEVEVVNEVGNPLPVTIVSGVSATAVFAYNENVAVPQNVDTTVLSYTVATLDMFLEKVGGTGDADAVYSLYINAVLIAKRRTSSANRNFEISFAQSKKMVVGTVIEIKIFHSTGATRKFSADLAGFR